MLKERISDIDISKGLLIILVVIGHSGSFLTKYIFWFHMPAFFFISGILFKEINYNTSYVSNLLRKYKSYGILYLSYFVLVTLVSFNYLEVSDFSWYKTLLKLFIGGRYVGKELGVFWFVSCLAFSITIFTLIKVYIKQKKYQYMLLACMYLLAHLESYLKKNSDQSFYIPLNFDVALLATCYIAAGFYLKEWIYKISQHPKLNIRILVASLTLCLILIVMDMMKVFDYKMDMKFLVYNSLFGDIFIPLAFTIFIVFLSSLLSKIKVFTYFQWFGYYSIVIMFLHLSVKEILLYLNCHNWIIISLLGSIIPLILAFLFDKNKISRFLFIRGEYKTTK